MKTWKKILLILLSVLVLAVAGVCIWQWDKLQAAYKALTTEPEIIAQDLDKIRTDYQQTIREEAQVEFQPPTLEQSENLMSGVQKPEEVKEELGVTEVLKPKEPTEKAPTAKELLDRCVAELTSCQVDLMAVLGGMKQEAIDEWNSLTPEARTPTKKKEIALAGLEECYDLEIVIDGQVREILGRYETALKAIGADRSPLDTLWNYYEEEKAAQKAYYINKYLD